MKKACWILFGVGLGIGAGLLFIRPYTGYMDADYYFAGAKTLFEGRGWFDYSLWNYLANPTQIPFPAFTYWMPMASFIATAGMAIVHESSLVAARLPFILLFSICSPLTCWLSYRLFKHKTWAVISGSLVLFGGYYLKFVTEPDGFALLFLCGLAILYLVTDSAINRAWFQPLLAGLLCGLIHLTRADGVVWLPLFAGFFLFDLRGSGPSSRGHIVRSWSLLLGGYLLITFPWYLRNLQVFGSLFPPGNIRGLWITDYNQLFSYPPDSLSLQSWLASGWQALFSIRLKAILINTLAILAVNGMVILAPGIIAGWASLGEKRLKWFSLASLTVFFLIMTILFPVAGMRGGLLHSLAIFQPLMWILAPVGTAQLWEGVQQRNRKTSFPTEWIQIGLIIIAVIISVYSIVTDRLARNLNQSTVWAQYLQINEIVSKKASSPMAPVIVNNPPAYYAATGRPALMIPYGTESTILDLASRFSAEFLLIDENHIAAYDELFRKPELVRSGYDYVGQFQGIQIFQLTDAGRSP